jgi:DNA polymerase III subunit beta
MKFRVEHDAFAEAVAWVARSLPSRPVVPVLSGMRLEARDGLLALSCFDYELAATARITADVHEPGTELVPGRLLAEITRSLPGQPAEVGSAAGEVNLSCGSAEFALVSLPLADYPALPEPPPQAGTIEGGAMAAAVAQVLPAASRDDTLPILTAVCLDIDGGQVTLAATDRYRMAVRRLHWEPADPGLRAVVLVPARTLADAARIMAAGAPVTVAFEPGAEVPGRREGEPRPAEGMITFSSGGRRLTGRLIAGEFIRYEARFPTEFGSYAEVPAASFTEAVRRVSLVADRASPVRLTFAPGKAVIEAQTEGRARAVESVVASFHGDESAIAFNPHYLLDGLTAAASAAASETGEAAEGGGEEHGSQPPASAWIRLDFTSPAKPALITPSRAADPSAAGPSAGDPVAGGPSADGPPDGGAPASGPSGADAGEGAAAAAAADTTGGASNPAAAGAAGEAAAAAGPAPVPAFRYLVVPLRPPARS